MSETADVTEPEIRRVALAMAGLLLALGAPLLWWLTLSNNFLHRSGLMMWLAVAAAVLCAVAAVRRDRRLRTQMIAGCTTLLVMMYVAFFVFGTRLPASSEFGRVERVADAVIFDHLGQPTSLSKLLSDGPVLLVFYRGHW
jgi:hypothetical protein